MNGGEEGIRTLDTLLTYTPLAGERLRPLGHLSGRRSDYVVTKWIARHFAHLDANQFPRADFSTVLARFRQFVARHRLPIAQRFGLRAEGRREKASFRQQILFSMGYPEKGGACRQFSMRHPTLAPAMDSEPAPESCLNRGVEDRNAEDLHFSADSEAYFIFYRSVSAI